MLVPVVVLIILITTGIVLISMKNGKSSNIVNKPLPFFQRNNKTPQTLPKPLDIPVETKKLDRVKDIVDKLENEDTISPLTVVNIENAKKVIAEEIPEKKRQVDLKIQATEQATIEYEKKARILAEEIDEKKRQVDLKMQAAEQETIEYEKKARILAEEIAEKKRQVDLKMQAAKKSAEQAKKARADRAAAFRAKMAKYNESRLVVEEKIVEPTVDAKYARALEIALKNKAVRLKAEAEMKQLLDQQLKIQGDLSEKELDNLDAAEKARQDMIDENDDLIEKAAIKRAAEEVERVAAQAILDEEVQALRDEAEELRLAEEKRFADIQTKIDKATTDALAELREAEQEQLSMDQAVAAQLSDLEAEIARLESIARDAQLEFTNNQLVFDEQMRQEGIANMQFLSDQNRASQHAFAGMFYRKVKDVNTAITAPAGLEGKVMINASDGLPVEWETSTSKRADGYDGYKLSLVDDGNIKTCIKKCNEFHRCEGFAHDRKTDKCYLKSRHAEQLEEAMPGYDMYYKSFKYTTPEERVKIEAALASKKRADEMAQMMYDEKMRMAPLIAANQALAREKRKLYEAAQDALSEKRKQDQVAIMKKLKAEQEEAQLLRAEETIKNSSNRCGPTQPPAFATEGQKCTVVGDCCGAYDDVHGRCGSSSKHCDNRQFWSKLYKYDGPTTPPKPENDPSPINDVVVPIPIPVTQYRKVENTRIRVPLQFINPKQYGKTSINASDGSFVTINGRPSHKLTEVDKGDVQMCMQTCNSFDKCEGFVHERSTDKCFLKSVHAKQLEDSGIDGYDMYYKYHDDLFDAAERGKAELKALRAAAPAPGALGEWIQASRSPAPPPGSFSFREWCRVNPTNPLCEDTAPVPAPAPAPSRTWGSAPAPAPAYNVSKNGRCGRIFGGTICPGRQCCSSNGWCGGSVGGYSAYCAFNNKGVANGKYDGTS